MAQIPREFFYYARGRGKAFFGTEPVRYFYLSRHWRKPLDFSFEALAEAKAAVTRVYNFLAEASRVSKEAQLQDQGFRAFLTEAEKRFWTELDDDFNTPGALAIIQEILGEAYKTRGSRGPAGSWGNRAASFPPLGPFPRGDAFPRAWGPC
jgi:cysteinyl-tRNA synthetase